ncbi:MAG: GTPase [Planctomycetota bacterium]|jgi:tRNA modification GTPase
MSAFAAVMTGKGTGAISTVEVFGDGAGPVVERIFKPAGGGPATLETGKIMLGTITDGTETIDQVLIGCEAANDFAINCHGNPLIVEMIMQLLQRQGVKLITAEQLLARRLTAQQPANTIAVEAKLAQASAMTLEGTKIILNQIEGGLNERACRWLDNIGGTALEHIKAEAEEVLSNSQIAKLIIDGCTVVITGPPNSGKSTLLNYLCGRQKAIVTDIKGTTRDWVSARCKIGPLSVELIDTAGLQSELAETPEETVEKASQQKALEVLENADLILLVLDNSEPASQLGEGLLDTIKNKKVLTVLNKSDLPAKFNPSGLSGALGSVVRISAKLGANVEELVEKIPRLCGADDFAPDSAVCVTARQHNLLEKLRKASSKQEAASIITELLNGPPSV